MWLLIFFGKFRVFGSYFKEIFTNFSGTFSSGPTTGYCPAPAKRLTARPLDPPVVLDTSN